MLADCETRPDGQPLPTDRTVVVVDREDAAGHVDQALRQLPSSARRKFLTYPSSATLSLRVLAY